MNEADRMRIHMAAATGALYLDTEASLTHPDIVPVHWHRQIIPERLHMGCPTHCLLAQLGQAASGHCLLTYYMTALALDMDPKADRADDDIVLRGFELLNPSPEEYAELTRAWTHIVLDRLAAEEQQVIGDMSTLSLAL